MLVPPVVTVVFVVEIGMKVEGLMGLLEGTVSGKKEADGVWLFVFVLRGSRLSLWMVLGVQLVVSVIPEVVVEEKMYSKKTTSKCLIEHESVNRL